MVAFIIWAVVGIVFVIFGVYCMNSKKERPFGFWANAETFPVKDIKAYNKTMGILWIVFGFIFALLGIPLLLGQNSGLILISVIGAMFEAITIMIVYVLVIEPKYRKK